MNMECQMKDLWKAWGEDVEGSGQGVRLRSCLNCKCTKNLSGKLGVEWWFLQGRRGVHHLVDDTPISQLVVCSVCPGQ